MTLAPTLAALFLAQTPGATSAPPPPPADHAKAADPMTCKRIANTGTRFARTVCAPKSQWTGVSADGRANTEAMQSHRDFSPPPR